MSGLPARARMRWLYAAALSCLLPNLGLASQTITGASPAAPARAAPEVQPERPISLQEAIQIAHQNHARVAAAEEAVEAARQRVREARTGTLPVVTGEVAYRGRGTSSLGGIFGGEPSRLVPGGPGMPPRRQTVDTDTTMFDRGLQPRFSLNYNVFDGGLTRTQVRQAQAGVESNAANLVAVRNNLAFTVATDYLVQLRSERLLDLRIEQERLAREQLARVEAAIRAGKAAAADRALVLSEYRNRQVDRILAQNQARVAANSLRNSMGLPVGPPLRLVELRQPEEPPAPLETLRDAARRQRPEVVQAEAQARIAQASVSVARIQRKPRLNTTFVFNVSPNNGFQRSDYAFAAGVSMPIWDAGLTHAREEEARTAVQSAEALLEQAKKDVTADVEEAYLNLVSARERLEASRLAVEAAQVNLEQTTARYELGFAGVTVIDLIQAQVQFANANNNAIQALYDVHLAQAQLNRAIGK